MKVMDSYDFFIFFKLGKMIFNLCEILWDEMLIFLVGVLMESFLRELDL